MAIENFRQLAAYNHWANLRLYGAALELAEEAYRRPTGIFFGSLHGTLNHLLVADRVWLKRLTGTGEHPDRLDAILHDDRHDLLRARIAEDGRINNLIESYADADLTNSVAYHTGSAHDTTSRCRISCCISSIIRLITAARRTRAFPSLPAASRRRSTCWRFSAVFPHQAWGETGWRPIHADDTTARNSTPCRRIVGAIPK